MTDPFYPTWEERQRMRRRAEKQRAEVDIWEGVLHQKVREYRSMGLSYDEAEERAAADVRREIQGHRCG